MTYFAVSPMSFGMLSLRGATTAAADIERPCLKNSAVFFQIIYKIKKGSVSSDTGVNLTAEEVCQRIFQEVDVNSDGGFSRVNCILKN